MLGSRSKEFPAQCNGRPKRKGHTGFPSHPNVFRWDRTSTHPFRHSQQFACRSIRNLCRDKNCRRFLFRLQLRTTHKFQKKSRNKGSFLCSENQKYKARISLGFRPSAYPQDSARICLQKCGKYRSLSFGRNCPQRLKKNQLCKIHSVRKDCNKEVEIQKNPESQRCQK